MRAICKNTNYILDIINGNEYEIRTHVNKDAIIATITIGNYEDILCYESIEEFLEDWRVIYNEDC